MYGQYSNTPRPYRTVGDNISEAKNLEGKRVKTVFDNAQCFHVWAAQTQDAGRTNNGNVSFKSGVLYSYNAAIAAIVKGADGRRYGLVTNQKYSVTTGAHVSSAWRALGYSEENQRANGLAGLFHVPFIASGSNGGWGETTQGDIHEANRDSMLAAIETYLETRLSARLGSFTFVRYHYSGKDKTDLETANEMHAAAIKYCAAFGAKLYTKAQQKKRAAAIVAKCEAIEARMQALQAKRETPAYKRAQERKAAADAAFLAPHLDAARRYWLEHIEARGWPEHIGRVYKGYDSQGVTPNMPGLGAPIYETLEGEALDAARNKWLEQSISETGRRRAKDARRDANKLAERIALAKKNAAGIAKWKAGETAYCPAYCDEQGGAFFRILGNELQSSQGARVPLDHAIRVFKFVRLIRERHNEAQRSERSVAWETNGRSLSVGHFKVSRVYNDGSFIAGCHTVYWPAIEEAAKAAGVWGEAAADTTEQTEGH